MKNYSSSFNIWIGWSWKEFIILRNVDFFQKRNEWE